MFHSSEVGQAGYWLNYARADLSDTATWRYKTPEVTTAYWVQPIREGYIWLNFKLAHQSGNKAAKVTNRLTEFMLRDERQKCVQWDKVTDLVFKRTLGVGRLEKIKNYLNTQEGEASSTSGVGFSEELYSLFLPSSACLEARQLRKRVCKQLGVAARCRLRPLSDDPLPSTPLYTRYRSLNSTFHMVHYRWRHLQPPRATQKPLPLLSTACHSFQQEIPLDEWDFSDGHHLW
jgi:hypothetical protein